MKKQPVSLVSIALIFSLLLGSCSKEYSASGIPPEPIDSFNLTVNFKAIVDSLKLRFDTVTYRNYWKESYTVSAFKFYVSKFDLINTDSGRVYHVNTNKYFLVNAADSASCAVHLLAAPFVYNRISFQIGVDSVQTVSGIRKGALDSAKGMYWSKTAGYVMARLEGHSPSSSRGDKMITYQIGGFSGDSNAVRKPTLLFPYGQYLQIIADKKSVVNINADVNAWFYNPHQVKIATTPACTSPGVMAVAISENYSKMFTVINVSSN